ncbi:MAG: hypothetical protein JSR57_11815 [Verrucomicrobia bacterium]|nr:hypothetical protein [Verrucomicrobiota bacterium]
MAAASAEHAILTPNSVLYPQLHNAPTQPAGKFHTIELPFITIDKIGATIGKNITQGDTGSIYRVKDAIPSRVYKIIALKDFKSGDEIRISKIASDLMLAPTFYSASLVKQGSSCFVVIEMDDAGLSLGKWMEKLAESEPEKMDLDQAEPDLSQEELAFREMMKKLRAEYQGSFTVTEVKQPKKLSMEETIEKLYGSQEAFYFTLFSKIKTFAENNISYGDTHVGNIMPNHGDEKGMQLIDFDCAAIFGSTDEAAKKTLSSVYTATLFKKFVELPNLSVESKELIAWFSSKS